MLFVGIWLGLQLVSSAETEIPDDAALVTITRAVDGDTITVEFADGSTDTEWK
jgi:hypothetical protein